MSEELERSRRRLEVSLAHLRHQVESEIGWVPPAGRWTTILIAAATGFAVGSILAARRRALPSGSSGQGARRRRASPSSPTSGA